MSARGEGSPPLFEHGAQLERTLLAWHRTALVLLLNGGLLLRAAVQDRSRWLLGPAILLIGTAGLAWLVAVGVYAHGAGRARTGMMSTSSTLPVLGTALSVALSLVGATVIVVG